MYGSAPHGNLLFRDEEPARSFAVKGAYSIRSERLYEPQGSLQGLGVSIGRAVRDSGTQKDVVTGYMYLILSKEQNRGSVRFREEAVGHWMGVAENHLTYSEIDEAKRRARKWKKGTE